MLQGKTVNLRVMEKADLVFVKEWVSDRRFAGEHLPFIQETVGELEAQYERTLDNEGRWFFIETKAGTKIGYAAHYLAQRQHEIGYGVIPEERGKGYCTEAAMLLVDYLFLNKNIERIQADANVDNAASRRVLEKAGFTQEGVLRKYLFIQGAWCDAVLYSILRDEWQTPKILPLT